MATDEPHFIEVTIRCAFQTTADLSMNVPLGWTIKQLKEHIHIEYPSHPPISSQKIIYCGGCLADERILNEVFDETRRVVGAPQVLHLVCPLPQSPLQPELRRRGNFSNSGNHGAPMGVHSFPGISTQQGWGSQFYGYPSANPGVAVDPTQYGYAEYYANYMNHWQQYQAYMTAAMNNMVFPYPNPVFVQNGPGMPMTPYYGAQPINLTGGNNQPIIVNANVFGHPQPNIAANIQAAGADPNVAANGGAVPVVRRRRMEDVLDFVYKMTRVLFLLTAVLLYTTMERFLLVLAIVVFIAITHLRRAQNRRAEAAEAARRVNNNNAGEQQAAENGVNADDGIPDDGQPDGSEVVEQNDEVPLNEEQQQSGLQVFASTCYSFVTSFITSLVPENIPVDVN